MTFYKKKLTHEGVRRIAIFYSSRNKVHLVHIHLVEIDLTRIPPFEMHYNR